MDERLSQSEGRRADKTQKYAKTVTYASIPAISLSDPTRLEYDIRLPTNEAGLGRYVCHHVEGTITLTTPAIPSVGDGWYNTIFPGTVVPTIRSWPLAGVTSQCSVTINDSTECYGNLSQWVRAAEKVKITTLDGARALSGTSSAPAVYNDSCAEHGRQQNQVTIGEGLLQRGDGVWPSAAARVTNYTMAGGLLPGSDIVLTVSFSIDEPLVVPPFVLDKVDPPALYGANIVRVMNRFERPERILSLLPWGIAGNFNMTQLGSISVVFTSAALRVSYITPQQRYAPIQRVPISVPVLYSATTRFAAPIGAPFSPIDINSQLTAPNSWYTGTVSSGLLQLSKVPKYALIWATPPAFFLPALVDNYAPTGPMGYLFAADAILPIRNCSINVCDRTEQLRTASPEQLLEISQKNGSTCDMWSFLGSPSLSAGTRDIASQAATQTRAFGYASSSPLVIDFDQDLSLPQGVRSGQSYGLNLSVSCVVANNLGGSSFLLPDEPSASVTVNGPLPANDVPVDFRTRYQSYSSWENDSYPSELGSAVLNVLLVYEKELVTERFSTRVEG